MKQRIHFKGIQWAKFPYSAVNVTILISPLIYAVISGFVIIQNIKAWGHPTEFECN